MPPRLHGNSEFVISFYGQKTVQVELRAVVFSALILVLVICIQNSLRVKDRREEISLFKYFGSKQGTSTILGKSGTRLKGGGYEILWNVLSQSQRWNWVTFVDPGPF